jgi:cobalamin biosynthesis Mg chelatase CobN
MSTLKTLSPSIEQPASAAATDVDGSTVAQEADADELLSASQLANVVAASGTTATVARPWLRNNSVAQAMNFRGPFWLFGQENWVYLLAVVLLAGGLYWHFKK